MPNKHYPVKMGIIFAGFLLVLSPRIVRAQSSISVALTGQITSQAEGPMEGVLVSAKGAGTNITVTVVSNDKGNYSFSGSQLKPGKYAVNIRAVGYEISSPKGEPAPQPPQLAPDKHTPPLLVSVDVAPNKTTKLDLKLAKSADLASQLTKAEWIMSLPGTDEQKTRVGGNGCAFCHSLERVVKSKYDAAALLKVVQRMGGYSDGSTPFNIVKIPKNPDDSGPREPDAPDVPKQIADYLATLNLSATDHWKYELKTLLRPKGQATKVVYTEYDLPRRAASPHDAVMGPDGMVWYTDFGSLTIGRLDPRTGEVKEFTLPIVKPSAPRSGLLSMSFDKDGNPWAGSLREGAVYKFDKKTEKFSTWSAPGEYNNVQVRTSMLAPQHSDVDGKVWFDNALRNKVLHRINLATNQVETVNVFPDKRGHSVYGIASDPMNNLIFTDYAGSGIGIIDAKTTKVTVYPTPTPNAWPRRGSLDSQGRFWFGENQANKLGMFDTKTKQFKEWEMPTPWTDPYDAMLDKNGDAWTAGMMADRVIRLNPTTGKTIEYLLPRPTQTRRVFVDNSTTPVTFWVGSNLGGSIVRVQPVE